MSTKDVLLVGLGAVGTIYAYILQSSKLARVTVVARSNYDIVNGELHLRRRLHRDLTSKLIRL
jgi:2-dehydropantoate 2-reductase